jgi:hypothetical protein
MTVLARFGRGARGELVSIECDVCIPPVLSASTEPEMRHLGWLLAADGHDLDVCPGCVLRVPERSRRRRVDATAVTPDPARLPNLFVIGAAKAGSTSLHNHLDLHPEISMSSDKEVRFFTDPTCTSWIGHYQDYFPVGTRYRGESTPQYTKWPLYPGVVDRMADLTPDARLIYLVRDPVERAIAEYVEEVTWGVIGADIEEELLDADAEHNRLLAPSRYATQLREFHRRFDPSQILVVDLGELAVRPAAAVARIFDFLELEQIDLDDAALRPRNAHGDKGILPVWYRVLRRPTLVRAARRLPKDQLTRIQSLVMHRIGKPVERPRPTEETVARLRTLLAPEVEELRRLSGLDLAAWSAY